MSFQLIIVLVIYMHGSSMILFYAIGVGLGFFMEIKL